MTHPSMPIEAPAAPGAPTHPEAQLTHRLAQLHEAADQQAGALHLVLDPPRDVFMLSF